MPLNFPCFCRKCMIHTTVKSFSNLQHMFIYFFMLHFWREWKFRICWFKWTWSLPQQSDFNSRLTTPHKQSFWRPLLWRLLLPGLLWDAEPHKPVVMNQEEHSHGLKWFHSVYRIPFPRCCVLEHIGEQRLLNTSRLHPATKNKLRCTFSNNLLIKTARGHKEINSCWQSKNSL